MHLEYVLWSCVLRPESFGFNNAVEFTVLQAWCLRHATLYSTIICFGMLDNVGCFKLLDNVLLLDSIVFLSTVIAGATFQTHQR